MQKTTPILQLLFGVVPEFHTRLVDTVRDLIDETLSLIFLSLYKKTVTNTWLPVLNSWIGYGRVKILSYLVLKNICPTMPVVTHR